ncbi:MAG: bifunctional 2-polyprenyl-6-hydroxyphenol methylase/3-demethylubiquinol 3-O-methyltransferase UbiG [Alphaproteobacteria bacterium]|nr:bifunctional 2-polyprenyl-6-hydroxyphenol methylase/3-demethylubiquinol 3-O-methyltransferase UbiG [Alphaproteobacteria bacterium]
MDGTVDEAGGTLDPNEIERFSRLAASWWEAAGEFQPLHRMNPTRLEFIRAELVAHFGRDPRSLRAFEGLSLIDVGCGGGLLSEPMARLGFAVTGIDASAEAIGAAQLHAAGSGLTIDYRVATAEEIAATGARYDAALAMELVEHVAEPEALFAALGQLVKPGGALIGATLNRTARSFALAIVGAEYFLGWLPRGTHDWRRFLRPSEFVLGLRRHGFAAKRLAGIVYEPRTGGWRLSKDLSVNYLVMAARR